MVVFITGQGLSRRLAAPGGPLQRRALLLWVHFDAFCLHPIKYLQAVVWRFRGLRVRSRNRFAALKGKSPNAYALWMATGERAAIGAELRAADAHRATIVPLVDCTETDAAAQSTIDSVLRAGFGRRPVIVGRYSAPGADRIDHPSDLANIVHPGSSWLCLLSPGDEVSADAGELYGRAAARSTSRSVIYADDDLIDERGTRHTPHFKPAWNPELFEHHDFVSGSAIVRAEAAQLRSCRSIQGLVQQAVTEAEPLHIPFVLHHRRQRPNPEVPVRRSPPTRDGALPPVDIIIPTRNAVELLRVCIDGLACTNYRDLKVTIVDNGSDDPETLRYLAELSSERVRVLKMPGPFNYSALNNAAVGKSDRELLCFLNNDVEIGDPDWLRILAERAIQPGLGAVGARLLYPDGTIQHAGVVTGVGGGAGHAHRFQGADEPGYFSRASLPQSVSAVTAACLVVRREKFLAVGGFDEAEFPVAFNDVDLCLKLNSRGWQSFYEPRATLIHHESKSRGSDRDRVGKARLAAELRALKRKWHTDHVRDPYHHVHLSPFSEQFVIAV